MSTRQEVKREQALAIIEQLRKKGHNNPVVVLPVYINEGTEQAPVWEATSETGVEGNNPDWCAVNVVSSQRVYGDSGFMNEQYRSALIRMKVTSNTFKPWETINGRIVIVESTTPTNANNLDQDVKYINAEAQANDLPCTVDGELIYRRAFFTEDNTRTDSILAHDNDDAIRNKLAEIRAIANKPITNALKNAAPKVSKVK